MTESRETPEVRKNILVSNMSVALWRRVKSQAAIDGETIPVFLERVVGEYLNAQG